MVAWNSRFAATLKLGSPQRQDEQIGRYLARLHTSTTGHPTVDADTDATAATVNAQISMARHL